jgi:2-(1,2-epoxy-1,2-dihydrophenyl)acetyl-CoA isomerase
MKDGGGQIAGLISELDGGVLRLSFDRSDKRNALDDVIVAGLISSLADAATDESVRVVVISGRGEHFCSGFDIVARNAPGGVRPRVGSIQRRLPLQANRLITLMLRTQVPIVCSVQGWAAGIGLNMALAADFTIAATHARFWAPFVDRGFTPDSGSTWMLPRRVGEVRAREMLLLGRVVSGAEAADWGMIHRSVEPSSLEAATDELVARLASSPTVAIGLAKSLLASSPTAALESQMQDESYAMELSSRSEDFKEGLAAFRDKRDPDFHGR